MIILGEKNFLRDFIKEDIEDRINWELKERKWLEWVARRKGYATEAWKLYMQYALAHGVKHCIPKPGQGMTG